MILKVPENFRDSLAIMVCENYLPFSIIESPSLQNCFRMYAREKAAMEKASPSIFKQEKPSLPM